MSDWDTVKKELGSSNSKILYFENNHSCLIDQIDDLKNEIQSLRMISEDLRPTLSPDKSYELILNEVKLLVNQVENLSEEACPVGETLKWFLSNEGSKSPETARPSMEIIKVLTGSDLEKAEQLARECMTSQIKILKSQAEQHMRNLEQDAYKPSVSNLTKLKRWLQTKISTSKNRRIISPKVEGRRPAVKSPTEPPKNQIKSTQIGLKHLKDQFKDPNPSFQNKILPKLVRVPSKEHIRTSPGGDGAQIRGPISSLRLKTSLSNPRELANNTP